MFLKYHPTLKTTSPRATLQWQAMIALCSEAQQPAQRSPPPLPDLNPVPPSQQCPTRTTVETSPVQRTQDEPIATTHTLPLSPSRNILNNNPRALSKYQQRLRRRRKEIHAQRVASGIALPTRRPPAVTPTYIPGAATEQIGWTKTYASDQPHCGSLCIMSWSCSGRLFSLHQQLDLRLLLFLDTVILQIERHHVDVMWLSDAHFLEGEMDRYLPYIYQKLPHSRVYQFPTTRVATFSYSDASLESFHNSHVH